MRSSKLTAALTLALLQNANALNGAIQNEWNLLAQMGLNPDGTPVEKSPAKVALSKSVKSASGGDILASLTADPGPVDTEYVELPLDHFGSGAGKFRNRYWTNTKSYRPGSPVFIYDVGEASADTSSQFHLRNETSFFKQMVDEFNGIGIVWEHRFYGDSSPVNISIETPADAFKFLTSEQALKDVDYFAKQFSRKEINATLTPDRTPWIFVGGSYPGMRAAFMRNMYPDTIYASWAASAPVEARVDQTYYFDPVWQGMNAKGFGNCTRDIQAAVRYMDGVLDKDKHATAKLKEQFLGPGAAKSSNAGFADALTLITARWQSYGMEGNTYGLRRFCDWIETDSVTGKTAPKEGWAPSKGAKWVVDRWSTYPNFVTIVNDYFGLECSGHANKTGGDCMLDGAFKDPSTISWTWQYCTEWGFFQAANIGPHQLVSKYNSLKHQRDICHLQFPNATAPLFPELPNTKKTNEVLGGWSIRPSNTYWSNGEFDPWRLNSPASDLSFAPKIAMTQEIPKCGVSTGKDRLFGMVLKDAEHCFDFRTTGVTVPDGVKSRELFKKALREWLKCYQPKKAVGRRWNA